MHRRRGTPSGDWPGWTGLDKEKKDRDDEEDPEGLEPGMVRAEVQDHYGALLITFEDDSDLLLQS